MSARIFDCVLYNGEIDLLKIRLNELDDVVDVFVVVEATRSFSGMDKPISLHRDWAQIKAFAHKLRHVVVGDDIDEGGAWDRERFQRNCVTRALLDARPDDIVCLSDVDEIPKSHVLGELKTQEASCVGFKLSFFYFALNYQNVAGPESDLAWSCAFPAGELDRHQPDQLRYGIRNRSIESSHIDNAGWHFSYLSDLTGIKRKIAHFSHQEFNNPKFLDAINLPRLVAEQKDFFGRQGFQWKVIDTQHLPAFVQAHLDDFRHLLVDQTGRFGTSASSFGSALKKLLRPSRSPAPAIAKADTRPVVICPYVHDEDRQRVVQVFKLDQPEGRSIPFFFWKDERLIGPERAFQYCWSQFPDRDVIIVHTDMRPMPDDQTNAWYEALCQYAARLPEAAMIACDLLYPVQSASKKWYVQCAGGFFEGKTIHHIGGGVEVATETVDTARAVEYGLQFAGVRPVQWATFGGIYLRRSLLDMLGDFDTRYQWAYVMDVDYCLEAKLRGQRIFQVPVNLIHEESMTSRPFLEMPEYLEKFHANFEKFNSKWDWLLPSAGALA